MNGQIGPEKIAILGGGMASLTAAFELTSKPNWQEHFDITVYQMGWRLGGKGASGRNPHQHDRIEEHGLHVWLGFYQEAFRILRACYGENARPAHLPLSRWQDAFISCDRLAGVEYIGGQRLPWHVDFPLAPGLPGDPEATTKPHMWRVVRKVYTFMKALDSEGYNILATTENHRSGRFRALREGLDRLKMKAQLGGVAVLEFLPLLMRRLGKKKSAGSGFSSKAVHWLLDSCRREAWEKVADSIETDTMARRSWIMLDLFIATVKGLHGEAIGDFEDMSSLDRYDFREFLAKYGASEYTLQSPVVCGFYNLGFAYLEGKKSQPSLAAGVILRFSLQMFFNYRGAMFWKMTAGMGDVVFAPLYEVLKKRGVTFKFFHRVTSLQLNNNQTQIQSIHIDEQIALKHGTYDPFITVKDMPCWPSFPRYEQLVDGDKLQASGIDMESDWNSWPRHAAHRLEKGRDFDRVILGIALGALPPITASLMNANQRFKTMVEKLPTVATCAAQLWLHPNLEALGWDPRSSLFDGEGESMNTWSDMTHLLKVESWEGQKVGHLAYFCGVLEDLEAPRDAEDDDFPRRMAQHAHAAANQLLDSLGHLWPGGAQAVTSGALDRSLLIGEQESLASQFYKANCHLSDRYILAAKGTTQFRLKPDESGFANLILTGDWTENGLNYGCIEAATRSGVLAAKAIIQSLDPSLAEPRVPVQLT